MKQIIFRQREEQSGPDPRDLDSVLWEIATISNRAEFFDRFIRRRAEVQRIKSCFHIYIYIRFNSYMCSRDHQLAHQSLFTFEQEESSGPLDSAGSHVDRMLSVTSPTGNRPSPVNPGERKF